MTRIPIARAAQEIPSVRRSLGFALLAVSAAAVGVSIGAPVFAAEPVTEIAGTRMVCARGPDSRLARAERRRGAAGVTGAEVLPNPSLVVEHQQTLSGGREQETVVGVALPLRIGGRRSLLMDAAAARSEQAGFDANATLLDAALSFREAYVSAAADRDRVLVLTEQQAALDELSKVIQGLAGGGEAAGYDLLRHQAQALLHRRTLTVATARARASHLLVEGWLGSGVALAPLVFPDRTAVAGSGPSPSEGAVSAHPRLRSLEAESRASALEARAARRRWVPELELFAGYRSVSVGPDTGQGISAALTVPLTFFDHGQGEAARADAEREIAIATAARLERDNRARLASARAELDVLAASTDDTERAIEAGLVLRDKAGKLYAAGESTITELLEVFHTVEEARLGRIDTAERIAFARLTAMRAAGAQFDAQLDLECGARRSER